MNDYRFGFEQQQKLQQQQQQLFHLKQKPFDQFCSLMLATLVNKKWVVDEVRKKAFLD